MSSAQDNIWREASDPASQSEPMTDPSDDPLLGQKSDAFKLMHLAYDHQRRRAARGEVGTFLPEIKWVFVSAWLFAPAVLVSTFVPHLDSSHQALATQIGFVLLALCYYAMCYATLPLHSLHFWRRIPRYFSLPFTEVQFEKIAADLKSDLEVEALLQRYSSDVLFLARAQFKLHQNAMRERLGSHALFSLPTLWAALLLGGVCARFNSQATHPLTLFCSAIALIICAMSAAAVAMRVRLIETMRLRRTITWALQQRPDCAGFESDSA